MHVIKRVPLFKEHSLSASAVWRKQDTVKFFFMITVRANGRLPV